ncbi:MAG: SpoIIE family protein phosphatase [Corallococcus sp.]|nr:SpoIIE family protein phosphatase [Corallococcus sp.]
MKKLEAKTVLLHIAFTASMFLCRNLFDGLLAFGVFIGGIYCANPLVAFVSYLCNAALYGLDGLLYAGVRAAVVAIALLIHKFAKRKIGKIMLALYYVLSNVFYCAYKTADYAQLFDKLVNIAAGFAFAYICIYVFRAVFVRGLRYRPALDETVCMALFAVVMSMSLAQLKIGRYNLLSFVAPFVLLFCVYVLGNETAFVSAAVMGLGALFASGKFDYACIYVMITLVACALNKLNRYVAALSLVAADVLLAYFFNVYGEFSVFVLIPTAVSAIAFIAVPTRALNYCSDAVGKKHQFAAKSVVNKLRGNLSHKLFQLSDVFFAMKSTFVSMAMETVSKEDAKVAIVKETCGSVCSDCKQRTDCWRNNVQTTENGLLQLAECALSKGKTTILDVSPTLTFRCDRLSSVLSVINGSAETYSNRARRSAETDSSRLLIGEQLGGVSKLMQQLANDCKGKVVLDSQKEKDLIEELTFHNILTGEAVFIEQSGELSVILTVAKKDFNAEAISQIVSGVVKRKMIVDKTDLTESDNWLAVYMGAKPRYQVSYGLRTAPKHGSEISGDTHSFTAIENGKFMIAVCDGMGSGENAEKMSETAISLVENFYKAGFDNDVILSCVNRLLGTFNSETFTAVDICVVDLFSGLCDFIKLGACNGLVKCQGEVQYVSGSSLPLGVLEEMRPSVTTKAMVSGDMILIASDGLWDSMKDDDAVADIFAQTPLTNPQIVADEIMDAVMLKCRNKPQDDVTVVVARLVE